jgi:hypothetical protein
MSDPAGFRLADVGLDTVVAFGVAERTREIGIRTGRMSDQRGGAHSFLVTVRGSPHLDRCALPRCTALPLARRF